MNKSLGSPTDPTVAGELPVTLGDGAYSAVDLFPAAEPDAVTVIGGALNANSEAIGRFWLIALPLGYLVTAVYYRLRPRRLGVGGRTWPYVLTGVGLLAALVVSALPLRVPMLPLMPLPYGTSGRVNVALAGVLLLVCGLVAARVQLARA